MKLSKLLLEKAGNRFINVGYGMKELSVDKNTHIHVNIDADVVTVYLPGYVHVEFIPNRKRSYYVKYICGLTYDMGTITVDNNGRITFKRDRYAPSYITGHNVRVAIKLIEDIISKRNNCSKKEVVCNGWL